MATNPALFNQLMTNGRNSRAFDDTMSGQTKGSFLFIALPPEGQEKSLVYQQLKSKVQNAGTPLGEISNFPIPQFKVDGQRKDADDRLGHWIHWWC